MPCLWPNRGAVSPGPPAALHPPPPALRRRTPATAAEPGQAAGAGNGGQGAPGPGEDHDPDEADMEQLREDMQRLADLEAVYTHLKLQNSLLERQLMVGARLVGG